ncbi:RNA-binding cell elongation regulator Jag/EloR [Ferviditalea candida]|uniref:RNA-binding protein KhpB n=1 Tax=Ferviditalea candida TaxID=3108399 RepID=A0ABU5ZL64_9BACL|nr:RNA-binding cell elongation regulator Jag/EloR [Paenibacillaceae bacterium T2]
MKKITASGKTVEEAVKNGLVQLNVSEERVRVLVLEQPSKGLFGILGSKDAKVELELIPDPLEETIGFLQDVFESMDIHVQIDPVKDGKDNVILNLSGPELGILIGRRGQTLDALQFLTNIVANRQSDSHLRIILDAENFRERRRKTLEELSYRLAGRVVKSKKDVVLEPMSPQERKVIHTYLQDHPKVRTYSKGDEPNRRVVITLR